MSRRKRNYLPASELQVGDYILSFGDPEQVTRTERQGGWVLVETPWTTFSADADFQVKVPRHYRPMFPNSRNEQIEGFS